MAKQKNSKGKMSHCGNKTDLNHPGYIAWKRKLEEKQKRRNANGKV